MHSNRGKYEDKLLKGKQTKPSSHRIKSLSVSGGFLNGASLLFDEHLNCLIGGRGTGKTTVIEFVRYALGTGFMPDPRSEPKKARDLEKLVAANLGAGNVVTLEIETQSGLKYTVKRKGGDESNQIKDESGTVKQLAFRGSQVFDVEIYSQNDIENMASDPLGLLSIIDKFREEELNDAGKCLLEVRRDLDANGSELLTTRSQLAALEDEVSELDGITERLKALTVEAGDDPEEVTKQGAKIQALGKEKQAVTRLIDELFRSDTDLQRWLQSFEQMMPTTLTRTVFGGPNRSLLEELQKAFNASLPELREGIKWISNQLTTLRQEAEQTAQKIDGMALTIQDDYDALLAHHQELRGKVQERDRLQKIFDDLSAKQGRHDDLKEREVNLTSERRKLLKKLSEMSDKRFGIRSEIADFLNSQLGPMIRVQIVPMGNQDEYQRLLNEAMKRSGMQYARIVEKIIQRISPPELARLIQNGQADLLSEQLEIDRDRANKIIAQLQNSRDLFTIEAVELYDRPVIELKDGATYKSAERLSTGQKCTTILPILLLESVKPLIIDQPEDNLDNAFVYDTVVKSIRSSKQKRQLIFVTHNPNIPVLGDAEKVIVLHSDGQQSMVAGEGNVDAVKEQIETILEGGRDAFEERRRRYGH